MYESDKNRILNFLMGSESVHDFESWVYSDTDLESRVGAELYFELIAFNYKTKNVLDQFKKLFLGKYIPKSEFEYKIFLQEAGWYQGRSIELNLSKVPDTPEVKNAARIIEEYGGLKFINPINREKWTHHLIEFSEAPDWIVNMKEYGLTRNLVCFATAENSYVDLFVDEDNKFYQLDNLLGDILYEYKGLDFDHMMMQLLYLDEKDNFQEVGRLIRIDKVKVEKKAKPSKMWNPIRMLREILAAFRKD